MQPHAPTRQRRDIQGLRALAVLAVIAAHMTGAPAGGFVGVDVFFVISGFLITGLLLREIDRTGTISFRRFYERRAKRILPSALVVIAATVVGSFVLLGERGRDIAVDGVFSALFAGNWRFAFDGIDYFAQGTPPSPLQHYWSLGVEEQFYLVWPWVMLAIVSLAATRRLHRTRIAIVALTAASFAWALYETVANPAFAYFSTFSRAWELGIGAILAFLPQLRLSHAWRHVLVWAGIASIAASLVVITPTSAGWPAPLGLLPVVGSALVIIAGTDETVRPPRILTNRVATYLGDISYSLYLWHFPVAMLLVAIMPAGTVAYVLLALALTLVLSALSYHLVENPARRATWFAWRGGRIRGLTRAWIPTAASLAIVAIAGTAASALVMPLQADSGRIEAIETVSPDGESAGEVDCTGAGSAVHRDACAEETFDGLIPAPDALEADTGDAYACYMGENAALLSCSQGSEADDATRVALVGDSHAAALLPALEPQLASLGWRLDTYVGRGCALMAPPEQTSDCDVARPDINAQLVSGDYDIVLATSTRRFATPADSHAAILTEIAAAGTRVVVIEDNPMPDEESIACTTRLGAGADSGCGTSADVALASPHVLADVARDEGIPVVDMTDLYCADGFCDGIVGGVIVYRDATGHITQSWAQTMSAPLTKRILSAVDAS